jgi:hypothetical protein
MPSSSAVRIDNIPSTDKFGEEDAKRVIQIHRMMESQLNDTSRATLFANCKGPFPYGVPRQVMTFLLKELFVKRGTDMANMRLYLTPHLQPADGEFESLQTADGAINLLKMSDYALTSLFDSVFYGMYPKPMKAPLTSRTSRVLDWVQCEDCGKWRRLDISTIDTTAQWVCSMDSSNLNACATPEEQMEHDEHWDQGDQSQCKRARMTQC